MKESFENNKEQYLPSNENSFGVLYTTFGVKSPEELYDLYFEEDQKLMDSFSWDY